MRVRIDKHRVRAIKRFLNENLDVVKVVEYDDYLPKEEYGISLDPDTQEVYLEDCYLGKTKIVQGTFLAVTDEKECYKLLTLTRPDGTIQGLYRAGE